MMHSRPAARLAPHPTASNLHTTITTTITTTHTHNTHNTHNTHTHTHPGTKAADLLHFCFSRVHLSATEHADLLGDLPRLMATLRCALVPLFARGGVSDGTCRAGQLLRGILGVMWGFAAAMRAAGCPPPLSGGLLLLVQRLLAPIGMLEKKQSDSKADHHKRALAAAHHAAALRSAALGVLSCMELTPDAISAQASSRDQFITCYAR